MKKSLFKILISLFAFLSNAGLVNAYVDNSEFLAEFETTVKNEVKKQIEVDKNTELKIKVLNMPTYKISNGQIVIKSTRSNFSNRDIKRVYIYENGKILNSFPLSVQILVYKNVLVAKNPIQIGQLINDSNSTVKRAEVGAYADKILSSLPKDKHVSTRSIKKDGLILTSYIRTEPDVIKDSSVDIIFKSKDSLNITINGKALKEGSIGDRITVKSQKYNKTYNAIVTNKNEVTVRI